MEQHELKGECYSVRKMLDVTPSNPPPIPLCVISFQNRLPLSSPFVLNGIVIIYTLRVHHQNTAVLNCDISQCMLHHDWG